MSEKKLGKPMTERGREEGNPFVTPPSKEFEEEIRAIEAGEDYIDPEEEAYSKADFSFPDNARAYWIEHYGRRSVAVETDFGWFIWKYHHGFIYWPDGVDISSGKEVHEWREVTKEEALKRLKKIETNEPDYVYP